MKEKTIEELEKELEKLKESNKASWDMYGSELCAGDMLGKEQALQDQIDELIMLKALNTNKIPDQSLELDDDLLLAIIGGDGERVTVRKGYREIKLGELLFVGAKDKTLKYIVGVTEIRHVRMVDVDDDVVKAEGFKNWNDFYEGMKKFYPDLDLTDEVTVVYFEIRDVKTQ